MDQPMMKNVIYLVTKMKTIKIKSGDFVRISEQMHDEAIPKNRLGHVLEEYKTIVHYTNKKPVRTETWKVFLTNGNIIRIHEMFLEVVDESR